MNNVLSVQRKRSSNRGGYTLVELIVSFALIGIFMSSAAVIISGALRVHARMDQLPKIQMAADTIMETIVGEVTSASSGGVTIQTVDEDYDTLTFVDKNGYPVTICVGDDSQPETEGLLRLEYEELDDSGNPIVWYYSQGVYMHHYISRLYFTSQMSAAGKELITVELQLKNPGTGYAVDFKQIIECYNSGME